MVDRYEFKRRAVDFLEVMHGFILAGEGGEPRGVAELRWRLRAPALRAAPPFGSAFYVSLHLRFGQVLREAERSVARNRTYAVSFLG